MNTLSTELADQTEEFRHQTLDQFNLLLPQTKINHNAVNPQTRKRAIAIMTSTGIIGSTGLVVRYTSNQNPGLASQ